MSSVVAPDTNLNNKVINPRHLPHLIRNKLMELSIRVTDRSCRVPTGGGGIRDAASAMPYAPAESIGPMLPLAQANRSASTNRIGLDTTDPLTVHRLIDKYMDEYLLTHSS